MFAVARGAQGGMEGPRWTVQTWGKPAGLQQLILSIEYIFKRHKLTYLPFLLMESVRVNSPAIARPDIRRGGHARGIIHREGDKRKREDANRNIDVEKRRGRFQKCTKDDLHICAK